MYFVMFVLFLGHLQQNIHEFTMTVAFMGIFIVLFYRRVGCFASVLLVCFFFCIFFLFIYFFFFLVLNFQVCI